MRPDHQEFVDGLKLATIACVTAVLTATVVIGAGRAMFDDPRAAMAADHPDLIRVAAR